MLSSCKTVFFDCLWQCRTFFVCFPTRIILFCYCCFELFVCWQMLLYKLLRNIRKKKEQQSSCSKKIKNKKVYRTFMYCATICEERKKKRRRQKIHCNDGIQPVWAQLLLAIQKYSSIRINGNTIPYIYTCIYTCSKWLGRT